MSKVLFSKNAIHTYITHLEKRGDSAEEISSQLKDVLLFLSWAYGKDLVDYRQYQQFKDDIANITAKQQVHTIESQPNISPQSPSQAPTVPSSTPVRSRFSLHLSSIVKNLTTPLFGRKSSQVILTATPIGESCVWPRIVKPLKPRRILAGSTLSLQAPMVFGGAMTILVLFILGASTYGRFFQKAQSSFAYPSTPTFTTTRVLSFQGRLTDSLGNPIVAATNMKFKLYTASSGGSTLYDSGTCSISPDSDGVHNVLIGQDCGSGIASSVFTENAQVWLGVTVGSDSEMTPRQQIANVPYALNAETLQGLPVGSDASNVAFINQGGDLLLSTASPQIGSTYVSQDFLVSSAKAITIQSAGTGDVTLTATESGAIKFATGGTQHEIITNTGLFGLGTTGPDAKLDTLATSGEQLRLTYTDGSVYTGFTTNSSGDLTIVTTGGDYAFSDGSNTLLQIKDQGVYPFVNLAGKTDTGDPASCAEGDMYYNDTDDTIKICHESNSWEALDGGGASQWTDGGMTVYLTDTTDEVVIGNTSPLSSAKFSLDGDADQIQLIVQSHSTQTTGLAVFEQSDGSDVLTLSNAGDLVWMGNTTIGDASGDTVTANAAAWTFANDTTVALSGGVNGINFDSNTLSIDATNNRVGIGTAAPTSPTTITAGTGGTSTPILSVTQQDNSGQPPVASFIGTGGGTVTMTWSGMVRVNDGKGIDNASYNQSFVSFSGGSTIVQSQNSNILFKDYNAGSNSEWARFTSTGSFGVNTTGPDAKIDSLSTSGEQLRLTYTDGSVYTGFTVGSGGDLTIDSTGGDVIFANNDVLNIGGSGSDVAYNVIGDSTSGAANVDSDDDLYIEGNLEVDGTIYGNVSGSITPGFTAGSVVFAGSSGELAQDNANFFWDDSSNELGLSDTTPDATLDITDTTEQLRLSYETGDTNYASFTLGSGGDLTVAPTGGDIAFTGNGDFSGGLNAGSSNHFNVDSSGNIGIGTTATANYGIRFQQSVDTASASTSYADRRNVYFTGTTSGTFYYGNELNMNISSATGGSYYSTQSNFTNSSASCVGCSNVAYWTYSTNNAAANSVAFRGYRSDLVNSSTGISQDYRSYLSNISNASTGTISTAVGYTGDITNSSSGTISTAYQQLINSPTNASGTITNIYGAYIADQSVGTNTNAYGIYIASQAGASGNAIGLYIADADDYSIQLASTDGDAASGITFGTDTNLYRNSANQLHTDDSFDVDGNLITDGNTTLGDASGDTVTANSAAWTFANDTTVALSGGVNGINFDSNTLSIDATNNRVGIGTAAPDGKLHVNGASIGKALAIFNETGDQDIIDASASGTTRFRVANDGTIYGGYFLDQSNSSYGIDPAGTSNFGGYSLKVTGGALLAYDSGAVGIGSTSPTGKLQVVGDETRFGDAGSVDNATADGDVYIEDALEVDGTLYASSLDTTFTSGSVVFAGTSGVLSEDNSNFFWDDSSNELGLSDTTPDATLDITDTTEQLRLSYETGDTNYASFTLGSGGDLTVAPTGGDIAFTGNGDFSGGLNAGSSNHFNVDSSGNIGIGTTASSTYGIRMSKTINPGTTPGYLSNYQGITLSGTVGSTQNMYGERVSVTEGSTYTGGNGSNHYLFQSEFINNSSTWGGYSALGNWSSMGANANANSNYMTGYRADLYISGSNTGTGHDFTGFVSNTANYTTSTIATWRGFSGNVSNSSTGVITNTYQFIANSPTNASGTLTTVYGAYIADQSVGTNTTAYGVYIANQSGSSGNAIGLYIADADDYSIQLASTDGNAASGITFGTDTNLYRNAANQLHTDDSLDVDGNLITDGNITLGDASGDTVTANSAAWTFANDTTVALSGGVNGINFDSNTLSIDATNNRVGIGTAAPSVALEVSGNTRVSSGTLQLWHAGTNPKIDMSNGGGSTLGTIEWNTSFRIGNVWNGGATSNIAFYADAAEKMTLTGSGLLGVGTTGPDAKIDSLYTSGEQLRLTYTDGSVYTGFTTNSSGDLLVDPTGGDLSVDGNVLPNTDDTYDLGSDTKRWRDIYLGPDTLHIGTSTSDEGTISYTTSTNVMNINGTGDLAIDMTGNDIATPDRVTVGSSTAGTAKLTVTGAETGKALAIFNETGDQSILVASKSGSIYFGVHHNGDVTKGESHGVVGLNDQGSIAPNASFEINSDGLGLPDGWVDRVGTSTTTTTSAHGTTALLLDDQNDEVYSTCFPIAGGQSFDDFSSRTYRVSAWFRGIIGSLGSDLSAGMYTYSSKSDCESHTSATTHTPIGYGSMGTTYGALSGTVTPSSGQIWARAWAKNNDTSSDDVYVDGFMVWPSTLTHGLDLAETYPALTSDNLKPGEIVSMGTQKPQFGADISDIKRSSGRGDEKVFGVIATQPGLLLDDVGTYSKVKVALKGRVPVLVSTENGPINIGDPITASSKPGVGMKATQSGKIIGYAMTAWTHENPLVVDQVTVFVNPELFVSLTFLTDIQTSTEQALARVISVTSDSLASAQRIATTVLSATQATIDDLIVSRLVADRATLTDAQIENLNAQALKAQQIEAEKIQARDLDAGSITSDSVQTKSATISGTLVAETIDSQNIRSMRERLEALAQTRDDQQNNQEDLQDKLTEIESFVNQLSSGSETTDVKDIETYQDSSDSLALEPGTTESLQGESLPQAQLDTLTVTGAAQITQLAVADAFSAGDVFISGNQVLSMTSTLRLSALEKVELMNGGIVITADGSMRAKGEIITEKGIRTPSLKAVNDGETISVVLGQKSEDAPLSELSIEQNGGTQVASINAQGAAKFKELSLDTYNQATSSAVILSAIDNYRQNQIYAPALVSGDTSAGNGILPAGENDILIYNDRLTDSSVVTLTPTSSTQGQTAYVEKIEPCHESNESICRPYFRIALDKEIASDMTFNWLIVN